MRILILCFLLLTSIQSFGQEITLPYQDLGDKPMVEVTIDNKKFNFLFDTGAFLTVLNSDSFEGLKTVREVEVNDINGVVEKIPVVRLADIILDKNKFTNHEVLYKNLSVFNQWLCDSKIDGILGLDLMKDYLVEIDPPTKTIKFFKKEGFQNDFEGYIKQNYKHNLPTIKIKVGNKSRYVTVDTGSDGGLSISDYKLEKLIKEYKVVKYKGRGALGANSSRNFRAQTEINNITIAIDKLDLEHQRVTLNNFQENNVGFEFLKQFNMFLDVTEKVIYLKKYTTVQSEPSLIAKYGFWVHPNVETNVFYVSNIVSDNKQLELGDIINQINGEDVPKEFCDAINFFGKHLNTNMVLNITRNGVQETINYKYHLNK